METAIGILSIVCVGMGCLILVLHSEAAEIRRERDALRIKLDAIRKLAAENDEDE